MIDQVEELFTPESITPEARTDFITAIACLARSGRVAVLATLRSDFFEKCAEAPLLTELSKGDGLYHLLPPNAVEIGQMIREPALAAGLQFAAEAKQLFRERQYRRRKRRVDFNSRAFCRARTIRRALLILIR